MCECKSVMLYLTSYTIGTYGYSSKSVALRPSIKQLCWVGAVLMAIKPYNNIDDGSPTSLRGMKLLIKFNYYDCICIEL